MGSQPAGLSGHSYVDMAVAADDMGILADVITLAGDRYRAIHEYQDRCTSIRIAV